MSDILEKIVRHKAEEIAERMKVCGLADLEHRANQFESPTRGFVRALQDNVARNHPAVIAEVKKASPSKGIIRENFDPAEIAESYARGGATCLSVLTDERFFQGHDDYLGQARVRSGLPVLRKDFIIDPYQVYESRLIGADAILLIAAALSDEELMDLSTLATGLNLDILLEVHDREELDRALKLPLSLIGINNRNLRTFETSLDTTLNLLQAIPDDRLVVTESGIHSPEDVMLMRQNNVHTFLVGEAFMRADDPGARLAELFFERP